MIKIEGLSHSFGKNVVLEDVMMEAKDASVLGLVGINGAGKSTLMNIIGCLDVPTSGKYYLNDTLIEDADEQELAHIRNKEIGFIFQSFHLLQHPR